MIKDFVKVFFLVLFVISSFMLVALCIGLFIRLLIWAGTA
jgi:hypothetical protein